ncbi:MAG: PD-(D/E)XK nuclease family protein, partial [Duodenibacillus sp.]|nr:PD-(D/E)XK nuclease family protein [Duodenibacillus sp.]
IEAAVNAAARAPGGAPLAIDITPEEWRERLARAPFMGGKSAGELERCADLARRMIVNVLNSPLTDDGLSVSAAPAARRIAEMPFMMHIANGRRTVKGILSELAKVLPGLHLASDSARRINGFMSGSIDLMLEHGGKLWIIDWKSNSRGNCTPEDYDEAGMEEIIRHHRYRLQYLIYLLALKRHLASVLPAGEDPWQRIGGVLYVFLRAFGEARTAGSRNGVYHRDAAGLRAAVDRLDELFRDAAGEA